MANRVAISKRVRFEVFKRDLFACQYCGSHPPQVILHVDHIKPVAAGGGNEMDNLVTACDSCNLGKAAILLSSVPQSLSDKAQEIKEREEQIRGYHDVMQAKNDRLENEVWQIVHVLKPKAKEFRSDWFVSIRRFLEYLDFFTVLGAMENAVSRKPWSEKQAFLYFCGTCWRKIKGDKQ